MKHDLPTNLLLKLGLNIAKLQRSFVDMNMQGACVCRDETISIRGVTLPRVCAPKAHFGADFYPLNLKRIDAVACNSGFPLLPDSSGLLPARPTHALRICYVCLFFDSYPLNLERIAVACSSGFPLPVWF